MPIKNWSPCTYPGCNTLVRGGRCKVHPYPISERARHRLAPSQMGYDRAWQRIRKRFLAAYPVCQYRTKCRGAAATEVDHVVPLTQGGTNQTSNLRATCKRCHSHKTATRDMRRKGGKFSEAQRE